MIDYELKAKVIKDDIFPKLQKKISYSLFSGETVYYKGNSIDRFKALDMHSVLKKNKEYQEAIKINKASYNRVSRLRNRIGTYLVRYRNNCVFLTLTFTDETLKSTTQETRKKYVSRYLKSQSKFYVANIDFGKKNKREHYHALVVGKCDYKPWHKYGGIKGELVKTGDKTDLKISKYISKLTNHAIKETTKRCAIIYSR